MLFGRRDAIEFVKDRVMKGARHPELMRLMLAWGLHRLALAH